MAEDVEHAARLVELFRVDVLHPIGSAESLTSFAARFPYLRAHFVRDSFYFPEESGVPRQSTVLDVNNALTYFAERREWEGAKNEKVRVYDWTPDDPLADVFLTQLGAFPAPGVTGVDHAETFLKMTSGQRVDLDPGRPLPADVFEGWGIPFLCRRGLRPRYPLGRVPLGSFGVSAGDGDNFDDLVAFWNLRAADVGLLFIDRRYPERFGPTVSSAVKMLLRQGSTAEPRLALTLWSRHEDISAVQGLLSGTQTIRYPLSDLTWNGLNLQVPAMELGETSVLGILSRDHDSPKVSFALSDKPFAGGLWFHTQHLVASVSFGIGLYGEDRFTLGPPFVPELNEQCARAMYLDYDTLRLEPGSIGLVIDAVDKDVSVRALAVGDLMDWTFSLAGYRARTSNAGLIVRQLVSGLGGVQGGRVFKIPGVRRLVRTHGPTSSFTQNAALQLIGGKDPDSGATFDDHAQLYIEPRETGRLTPTAVFEYLVEKGVFRMGSELTCPSCRMASWTPLGALRQRIVCELCGAEHDVTRQLTGAPWRYRRSGILGTQHQAQGAIPVVVTLQQLEVHLRDHAHLYSPSLDLTSTSAEALKCEVDFVWVLPRPHKRRAVVILGECKDRGPIPEADFKRDVDSLRRVADALPSHRFKTFVLLAKMAPFTAPEIEYASSLNTEERLRVILLTNRELEPYEMYKRSKPMRATKYGVGTAEDLASVTFEQYFDSRPQEERQA